MACLFWGGEEESIEGRWIPCRVTSQEACRVTFPVFFFSPAASTQHGHPRLAQRGGW